MKFEGPFKYKLFISGPKDKRVISKIEQEGIPVKFKKPLTQNKQPKIYIVKEVNHIVKEVDKIIYVGYASQSIGKRLGQGMRAKGTRGYYGYGWKLLKQVELLVFVFKPFSADNEKTYKAFVEAIEAELVYSIRTATGEWPKYQHEIHFNNTNREEVLDITASIFLKATELK